MESIYPAGPVSVPDDLTRSTRTYRQRAWWALAGLGAFVAVYLGLTAWFVWLSIHLFTGLLNGTGNFPGVLSAFCSLFFAVFLLKALFFLKRGAEAGGTMEVTAAAQPQLFDFLNRLADEAKAPKPHRVFLSARVNAAVFYDLSLLNLLWPSKKNLEIGLGLVNVLTLGEFKAVLAHEFGHFAQRSMAVGRWVYVAQQVAEQIVVRRDAFDRFLVGLSRVDFRIAWIAWIVQLIVWSIRSLMETLFRGVIAVQRALSREMELQADLIAVSLTGSDALVHALYRIKAADEAWARTLAFARSELANGRPVADLFAVQQRVIEHLRRVLDQPDYGQVPPLPARARDSHRLFKVGLAVPPRMWATHPPSSERENNAKRIYVPASIDERDAWSLFADAGALRRTMSLRLAANVEAQPTAVDDSIKRLDQEFIRTYLDRRYRGAYLTRSPVRHAVAVRELYGTSPDRSGLLAELDALYPESLAQTFEQLRVLGEEKQSLEALHNGSAQAAEDTVRFRGTVLTRKQLPTVIAQLEAEIRTTLQTLEAHEMRCRTAHLAAAETLGNGWPEYLRGIAAILHYADHTEANLRDVHGYLANVYAVATVRRRVGKHGLNRMLDAAAEAHGVLREVWRQAPMTVLDTGLTERLGIGQWQQAFGEFTLPTPTRANIGDWLRVIDGWINSATANFSKLRLQALDALLAAEARIADAVRDNNGLEAAPAPPSQPPPNYATLAPGRERARQKRLHWWDRFQVADGVGPLIARLAVALSIVGGVLFIGQHVGDATITVYNGMTQPVTVTMGKMSTQVAEFHHATMRVAPAPHYAIAAKTLNGAVIESFDAEASNSFANYVYNVAGMAPMVQWTAVYGHTQQTPPRMLGAPRWSMTSADIVFEEPPNQISSKAGGGSRTVLSAFADRSPQEQLSLLQNDADAVKSVINRHAQWDRTDSLHAFEWLSLASRASGFDSMLAARLRESPDDVLLRREAQDTTSGDAHRAICERDQAEARAKPDNGDLQYLAARCAETEKDRDAAFEQQYQHHPNSPWLEEAVGYVAADRAQWSEATLLLNNAQRELPALAPFIALDLYRIYRVMDSDTRLLAVDLSKRSPSLRQELLLESDDDAPDGPDQAYHELAQGHLDAALKHAGSEPQAVARILRLEAASDGASEDLVERALALAPDQGIDAQSAWSALGLALRAHRDPTPFISALRQRGGRAEAIERAIQFVRSARPGLSAENVQSQLAGLDPELRGQAYSAAAVALGRSAPAEWKAMARKLLFASERPHFL